MRKSISLHLFLIFLVFAASAQAGTKEEVVRLQSDVGSLRDQLLEFEKTLSENNAALKSLIEQLNDQAAKSNMLLEKVLAAIDRQSSEDRSGEDVILPEIQSLSDKIDDMAMSISALARQVSELEAKSASINASASPALSSCDALIRQANDDLLAGNNELAVSGFNAYLTQCPTGDKATEARYNVGAAYFYMKQFQPAIEAFTGVIEENADSDKVAPALLKRGEAFQEIGETKRAVRDYREIIKRFPDASEAALAEIRLQDLGAAD